MTEEAMMAAKDLPSVSSNNIKPINVAIEAAKILTNPFPSNMTAML